MGEFEWVGYLASGLVFLAFTMKGMVMVRLVALCSNFAFLIYGIGLHLLPVAVLHLALIPVNCWRLWQALRRVDQDPANLSANATPRPGIRWLRA
jgi:hypothetical protein